MSTKFCQVLFSVYLELFRNHPLNLVCCMRRTKMCRRFSLRHILNTTLIQLCFILQLHKASTESLQPSSYPVHGRQVMLPADPNPDLEIKKLIPSLSLYKKSISAINSSTIPINLWFAPSTVMISRFSHPAACRAGMHWNASSFVPYTRTFST